MAHIGKTVEVAYDPTWDGELETHTDGFEPFTVRRMQISANCGTRRGLPDIMGTLPADTSRLLDSLAAQTQPRQGFATRFSSYWGGDDDV